MDEKNIVKFSKGFEKVTENPELRGKKSQGLGDSIKKVTGALGIKQCGSCKKRQATLNRLFPYASNGKKEP